MNIRLIRNATIIVEYAGVKFLVDPLLAEKGTYPGFSNPCTTAPMGHLSNPTVSLPTSLENILNVDAVILTHLHEDHFDEVAQKVLPKDIKVFVQNEEEAQEVKNADFTNVEVLQENTTFAGIQLSKTNGEHGRSEEVTKLTGPVSGVVFKHELEKSLYVAGDTVWCDAVQEAIDTHQPEIMVVNAGGNKFIDYDSIIMEEKDVLEVYKAAPNARIITVHLEAVNHWTVSRESMQKYAVENGMSSNVLIPADGESYSF
ncbi:MBL fold metallo-hydrolase [Neobacillus mesonae]|nr:MBL fold metallo-hydrolase [Neobacillus mesonae]